MKSSTAKSMSPKIRHRLGLALIAGGCCALLIVAYLFPHLLLRSTWLRLHFNLAGASWPWGFARAEASASNTVQNFGRRATLAPNVLFLGIDTPTFDQSDLMGDERGHPALDLMHATTPGNAFPRTLYPYIIERLVTGGAKVVVFDMTFAGSKDTDPAFRDALEKFNDHVVIGCNLQRIEVEYGDRVMLELPPPTLIPEDEAPTDSRLGYVNFKADPIDGIVRRSEYRTTVPEFFGYENDGSPELLSLASRGLTKAGLGALVPAPHEPVLFRFIAPPRVYSLHHIFVPHLWEKEFGNGALLKDKIVFIGPFGNWSHDELQTPLGTTLGPLIHLSAMTAALKRDFLHQTGPWTDLLFICLGGVVAVILSLLVAHPLWRTAALLGIVVMFVGTAFLLFNTSGLLVNLLGPSVALLSSGFVGMAWERLIEASEKNRIRSTLEGFVSRDVVKEVLDNPQSFLNTAGGMRKPVTLLFSDIRGFTSMTESADPAKLVTQLNEYFSAMVRIVFANSGTLDKFMGDAVMAHWGGIVSRGEGPDACRAVATALDMLQALPKLNADWKERGFPELTIGVGVNHGDAICAYIGSHEKHEFTAIGDAVNLASRLEGATKLFHQDLLIGERAAPLVEHQYVLRPVDLIQVKGKAQPAEVFAVLGDRNEMKQPAWLAIYIEGVRLFRARSFDEARAKFTEVLQQAPGDWLAQEYVRRCDEYSAEPPDEGWDGAYTMKTK